MFSLEDSEKRFEHRLQELEQPKENPHDNINYMHLYITLLEQHNALKMEYKQREEDYKQQIDQLTSEIERHKDHEKKKEDEESFYREEDGYLIFDSTSMSGEITHCRVKIPSPNTYSKHHPSPHFPSIVRFRSPHLHMTLSKGLNPNAPEWKRKGRF